MKMTGRILLVESLISTTGGWTQLYLCIVTLVGALTRWPSHVDCFASFYNTQTPRFFSRFWNPGAEAVNAFTVDWNGEICWWAPPLYLVGKLLSHARECSAVGTLIIPGWRSAPFWPVVCPDGIHFAEFIHDWMPVQYYKELFTMGRSGNSIGNALDENTTLFALFVDFSRKPRSFKTGFCTYGTCGISSLSWAPVSEGQH